MHSLRPFHPLLAFLSPPFPSFLNPSRPYTPSPPRARLQVEILTLCKRSTKDAAFDATIAELTKRMSPVLSVTSRWIKPELSFRAVSDLADTRPVFLLDERGMLPKDSRQFSQMVYRAFEGGGSRIAFVIGDADGLTVEVRGLERKHGVCMLSLSSLTFTHKMVSFGTATIFCLGGCVCVFFLSVSLYSCAIIYK